MFVRARVSVGSLSCLIAVMLLVASSASSAPVQGELSNPSMGSSTWTFGVPGKVRISGLSDVVLHFSGPNNPPVNKRVCIFSNASTTGGYSVEASGNYNVNGSAGTGFFLKGPASKTIPYTVRWNDTAADGGVVLTAGGELTAQSGADTVSSTCNNGINANFEISLSDTDIWSSPAGSYSSVLQLIIRPDPNG